MEITHKDVLGRDIAIGDCVAVSQHNTMRICQVTKFTPKMVRVVNIANKKRGSGYLKYANEMVIVPKEEVFIHMMTDKDAI